jgi:SAM-dependent methyltransferase
MVIKAINIGGGKKFKVDGWLNLDNVGADPFALTPICWLPVEDASLDLIYSSHTLEHLDDATVDRVLQEAYRALKPEGALVIKIPDFDLILSKYRAGDRQFFLNWPNIGTMLRTCANRGVEPTTAAIAAQCFCGFWNRAFGDMFSGYDVKRQGAYYGPPVVPELRLQTIMDLPSAHAIAVELRAIVLASERDYTFNHQNAWSCLEFTNLLDAHGFKLDYSGVDTIITAFAPIPGIAHQREISAYYAAVRRIG